MQGREEGEGRGQGGEVKEMELGHKQGRIGGGVGGRQACKEEE